MKRTLNTIIAIALLSLLPALFLYQGAQGQVNTEEQAVRLATDFLKKSPTYTFDGIEDSIELISVTKLKSPTTWDITLRFTARHGGYGDREGQLLLQVITEHTMVIEIMEGEVVSAITDGKFDEIQGCFIDNNDIVEEAEELAFEWLRNAPTFSFDGIEGTMQVLQSSTTLDTVLGDNQTVKYIVIIGFDCAHAGYGDRSDMMMAQVVTEHKAAVTVLNNQIQSVIIDEFWDELHQIEKQVHNLLPPEEILSITIEYLRENYPEAENLESSDYWTFTDLTEDIYIEKVLTEYKSKGWIIRIQSPTVGNPVYRVEAENDLGFEWSADFFVTQLLERIQKTDNR